MRLSSLNNHDDEGELDVDVNIEDFTQLDPNAEENNNAKLDFTLNDSPKTVLVAGGCTGDELVTVTDDVGAEASSTELEDGAVETGAGREHTRVPVMISNWTTISVYEGTAAESDSGHTA